MKVLARVLWALSTLYVIAAFVAFLAACWAHGDDAARWFGTGFVLLLAALVSFGGGAVAEINA